MAVAHSLLGVGPRCRGRAERKSRHSEIVQVATARTAAHGDPRDSKATAQQERRGCRCDDCGRCHEPSHGLPWFGRWGEGSISLTDPAATIALLKLDAVVGVKGTVTTVNGRDTLTRVNITCALGFRAA